MENKLEKTQSTLPVWKQQLVKAESKFLAIQDKPEKCKIELGFCAMIFEGNEQLRNCTPASILNSVINIARIDITLNPALKLAYLIPRKGVCVLDISYMGMREILIKSKLVTDINAQVVYQDEEFDISLGEEVRIIKHKPRIDIYTSEEQNKRKKIGAYSVATLSDGTKKVEWMNAGEILSIKDVASQGGDSKYSPWNVVAYSGEMWKKTVLKRHFKSLPKTGLTQEVLAAIASDDEATAIDFKQAEKEKTKDKIADIFGEETSSVQEAVIVNEAEIVPEVKEQSEPKKDLSASVEFINKFRNCAKQSEITALTKDIKDSDIEKASGELSEGIADKIYKTKKALLDLCEDKEYILQVFVKAIEK